MMLDMTLQNSYDGHLFVFDEMKVDATYTVDENTVQFVMTNYVWFSTISSTV